eukprot:3066267-Rhodomonas_salina.1
MVMAGTQPTSTHAAGPSHHHRDRARAPVTSPHGAARPFNAKSHARPSREEALLTDKRRRSPGDLLTQPGERVEGWGSGGAMSGTRL